MDNVKKIVLHTDDKKPWAEQVKSGVDMFLRESDGNIETTLFSIVENIMIRDMILDCSFNVSEDQKLDLFNKYYEMIYKIDREGTV